MIAGQVGFAGSSKIGNNVSIGGQAGISGHLNIGNKVKIGGEVSIKKYRRQSSCNGLSSFTIKRFFKE